MKGAWIISSIGLVLLTREPRDVILSCTQHFLVNGKKVNIPSYLIKVGDIIEVREKSRNKQTIIDSTEAVVRRGIPQWLNFEKDNFKGVIRSYPTREDLNMPIQEQLIVELYSK